MTTDNIVTITEKAEGFIEDLLKNTEQPMDIKLEVAKPGTIVAETMLSYLPKGEEYRTDAIQKYNTFDLYIGEGSGKFLLDTKIDYDTENFGGTLTIKSPNSKTPQISDDSSIEERISYVLQTEVNPMLASHGGNVTLHEFTEDKKVVVQFGGGCQGCQGVDFTMMSMVDNNLREKFPEITEVIDVTDHSYTANAYY